MAKPVPTTKPTLLASAWDLLKTIVYALLLAALIRTVFFQPFWIPTGSMKPTLLIGDFLFVNKFAYGYSRHSCPFSVCPFSGRILASEPERGDVIVFKHPTNGTDYIKRLIGLPGDRIRMQNGRLYINDARLELVAEGIFSEGNAPQGPMRSTPQCSNNPTLSQGRCDKSLFTETLPEGLRHATLDIGATFGDNTDEFLVPEGHYFMMGDNRDNSLDSRFSTASGGVGFVPAENLIGRADRIMFSSSGRSMLYFWTWRSDRFFKAVE